MKLSIVFYDILLKSQATFYHFLHTEFSFSFHFQKFPCNFLSLHILFCTKKALSNSCEFDSACLILVYFILFTLFRLIIAGS